MSEDHAVQEEKAYANLSGVFFAFIFLMLGVFNRQVGIWLKIRIPHHRLLLIMGMLLGFFYVNDVKDHYHHKNKIPVLDYVGVIGIQPIFTTLYFFTCGFNLDSESLRLRHLPYSFSVVILMLVLTVLSVSYITINCFDFGFSWKECTLMVIVISAPDLLTTKLFVVTKHNTGTHNIFSILEQESIVVGCIASVAHSVYLLDPDVETQGLAFYLLRIFFLSFLCFVIGKLSKTAVFRMHYDTVNQITVVISSILFTFACATLGHTSGDIAVLVVGVVLMNAKPSISGEAVEMINRFIEIFRFALVCVTLTVAGIVFTTKAWTYMSLNHLLHSAIIFVVSFVCRLLVITCAKSLLNKRLYIGNFIDILTLSFCNIRSAFNIIYIMGFLENDLKLPLQNDKLFLTSCLQIVWSYFVSTFFASFLFGVQRREKYKSLKTAMIEDAIDVINQSKDNSIKTMRNIPFRNDADWGLVNARTTLKKSLFNREHGNFLQKKKRETKKEQTNGLDPTQMREYAVCDVLRLQRRFLEEQFRHGTLGPRPAKRFAYLIKKCMHHKLFMSSRQVLKMLAPRRMLQVVIRDLVRAQNTNNKFKTFKSSVIAVILLLDLFINISLTLSNIFNVHFDSNYARLTNLGFSAFLSLLGVAAIFNTGKHYGRTVNYTIWSYFAWVFFSCTVAVMLIEVFGFSEHKVHGKGSTHISRVYPFIVLISSVLMTIRSAVLSCFLYPVQYLIYRITSSMLKSATFNQCDACHGYLQLMVDTHHRLRSRMLDPNFEDASSDILHEENLCMRQFLGIMEVLRPNVLTALRTKIACRLVLMSQERIINDLDQGGFLDDKDVNNLKDALRDKLKALNSFASTIPQSSMIDLVRSIPWILMTNVSYKEVIKKSEILCFQPGDVIQAEGERNYGIFVIMHGVVRGEVSLRRSRASSHADPIERLRRALYISSIGLDSLANHVEISDYYTRGNVIGEYTLLTKGRVHKTYRCVTNVLILGVPAHNIQALMKNTERVTNALSKLEHSMWTAVAIRQSARLIQWHATYHLLTRRQIYIMLEDSYVIDLQKEHVDLDRVKHAAIILLYGETYCPSNNTYYKSPCILPSSLMRVTPQEDCTDPLQLEPIHNIILVLRSFKEMRFSNFLMPLKDYDTSESGGSEADEDDVTLSSGSSDGIPNRHKSSQFDEIILNNKIP